MYKISDMGHGFLALWFEKDGKWFTAYYAEPYITTTGRLFRIVGGAEWDATFQSTFRGTIAQLRKYLECTAKNFNRVKATKRNQLEAITD